MKEGSAGRFVPLPYVFLISGLLIAAIAAVRIFLFQPVFILSDSMAPTMRRGDRGVAVSSLFMRGGPRRGDVVTFRDPRGGGELLVKRVVALPGERFGIVDGVVSVDGRPLDEPYIKETISIKYLPAPYIVPEGFVVVLGDNRNFSDDSLVWGPLPVGNITGRMTRVMWPPDRVKAL